jgi:hypothetical protein
LSNPITNNAWFSWNLYYISIWINSSGYYKYLINYNIKLLGISLISVYVKETFVFLIHINNFNLGLINSIHIFLIINLNIFNLSLSVSSQFVFQIFMIISAYSLINNNLINKIIMSVNFYLIHHCFKIIQNKFNFFQFLYTIILLFTKYFRKIALYILITINLLLSQA